jgi:hypothetical protein
MPMDQTKYPANWREVSRAIRERAGQRCECTGECGDEHTGQRCNAPNGETIRRDDRQPARWSLHGGCSLCLGGDPECRPVKVVLTVAHLDHDPSHADPARLRALCQRCHLRLDRHQHAANAHATRRARKAVGELPGVRRG